MATENENAKSTKLGMKEVRALVSQYVSYEDGAADLFRPIRLSDDVKQYFESLGDSKYIVRHYADMYRQSQENRINNENRVRALWQRYDLANTDHEYLLMIDVLMNRDHEAYNKKCIDHITNGIPICRWMKSIIGIGPILSASLYSMLDVTKAPYATNFLSYCGLNDNNNPWIGKESANSMVKEVVSDRDEEFKEIEYKLRSGLEADNVSFTKFKKSVVEGITKLISKVEKEYDQKYEGANMLLVSNKEKITKDFMEVYFSHPWDIFPIIYKVLNTMGGNKHLIHENNPCTYEYFMSMVYPRFIGDTIIEEISYRTTRNPYNIKKGTVLCAVSKFNSNKDDTKSKKVKFSFPDEGDLISYLSKPPYNIDLKVRCHQIGESFVKQRSRGSMYGEIYYRRLAEEKIKNERHEYAEQAEKLLKSKNFDKGKETTKLLQEGKLGNAHLAARASRYAVKLFISHVHEAMYYDVYRTQAPMPYIIEIGGHHDYIPPEKDYMPFLK